MKRKSGAQRPAVGDSIERARQRNSDRPKQIESPLDLSALCHFVFSPFSSLSLGLPLQLISISPGSTRPGLVHDGAAKATVLRLTINKKTNRNICEEGREK